MKNIFERLISEPLEGFLERFIQFLPNLISAMLLLLIGLFAGWLTKKTFCRLLRVLKVDEFSVRHGINNILLKGGVKESLSSIVGRLAGWLVFFIFLIISLSSLNVPAIERLLERFFLYLPNLFVAIIILLIGYLLSNFFGRAALIASVNAGLKASGLIGRFVKLTIFLLAATMALEQLGIGRETIIIAFAIVFGGIVLALAIAFGLGGRDLAKDYLEKKIKGEEKKDEISHL
ncbi:MAG: mechanosensitive ion channel family protein [Thermodesulfovibrionales bacterium]